MKRIIKHLFYACFISTFIVGCNFDHQKPQIVDLGEEKNYTVIADTLLSDVVILNPNEDEWTEFCLRNLDRKSLIEEIFTAVYNGDLVPYEFFNNKTMSIIDIKNLEADPEFSRDNIAKVQFEEAWYYEPKNHKMIKKVHSIMLAYEIYDMDGEVRGYKPAFKVYFK